MPANSQLAEPALGNVLRGERAVQDNDTLVWRLSRSGRITECFVRFAPGGVEVEIRSDGAEMITRRFTTGTEAMAWTEDGRASFEME